MKYNLPHLIISTVSEKVWHHIKNNYAARPEIDEEILFKVSDPISEIRRQIAGVLENDLNKK